MRLRFGIALLLVLLVFAIPGCSPANTPEGLPSEIVEHPDIEVLDSYVFPFDEGNKLIVFYDEKRDVTCWLVIRDKGGVTGTGIGLYCLEGRR